MQTYKKTHIYTFFIFSIIVTLGDWSLCPLSTHANELYFSKEAEAQRRLKAISRYADRWQNKVDFYYDQHMQTNAPQAMPTRPAFQAENMDPQKKIELQRKARNTNFEFSEDYSRETLPEKVTSKHDFKIRSEAFYARYEEPKIMKQRGKMKGIGANYTYRPEKGELLNSPVVNTYRAEGMYAEGEFQYEAEAASQAGLRIDKDDHMYEGRGLFGKEYADGNRLYLLYSGFGYRYLSDDDDGTLARVPGVGNFYGYKRESRYFYIPAGITIQNNINDDSRLTLNMEYNHLIKGKQYSRFSDGNIYSACDNDDVWNQQKDGYGLRGSLQYQHDYSIFAVTLEPFVRYWSIDDSDFERATVSCQTSNYWYEPENKTLETGAKFSLLF